MSFPTIPPIKVRFVPEGVEGVLAAFKSITKAVGEYEKATDRVAKATMRSAAAQQAATEKAAAGIARAVGRQAQSATASPRSSSSKGFESGIKLGGLAREIVLANVAMDAFRKGLSLVGSALSQFGGFLRQGVMDHMKRGTNAMQIANRAGGQIASGEMRTFMTDLGERFSSFSDEQISGTLKATTNRLELPQAKSVGELSLKMSQAFGYDPTAVADSLAQRRAALPGLDDATFEGLVRAEFGKLQAKGSGLRSFEELASMRGSLSGLTDRFVSPNADDNTRASTEIGLVGLVSQAAGKMKGAEQAGEGVGKLLEDLGKFQGGKLASAGFGRLRNLQETVPAVMKLAGGDANKMAAMGFGEGSVKLIRALGLESTYRENEAKTKGSGEGAVRKRLDEIMGVQSGATATFGAEDKRAEADAGIQLERAIRRVRDAFAVALAPTIEGKLIPALVAATPKLTAFVESLATMITEVDLVSVFKSVAQGIAAAMYYVLDMLKTMGVKVDPKGLGALGKLAGIGGGEFKASDAAQNLEADKRLHPELYTDETQNVMFGVTNAMQGTGMVRSQAGGDVANEIFGASLKKPSEDTIAAFGVLAASAKSLADDMANAKNPNRSVPMSARLVNQ